MSDPLDYIHPQLRALAVPLDTLTLDPKNAKKHGERNLKVISKSLEKFGMRGTIVVQKSGDTLVVRSGNGRVTAARGLGWTHLPALIYEEDDNESVAYAIVDNQSSDLGEWDFETLESLVGELKADDYDLDSLGFTDDELSGFSLSADTEDIEKVLAETPPDEQPAIKEFHKEDELPEEVEAITVEGEEIELGVHTLHCADCIEVMQDLEDNSVDAIVTDPPYGIGLLGKEWDCDVPGDAFAKEALRVLKPGGHLIAFAATRTYHRLACAVEDVGFEIRDQIGWRYKTGWPKSSNISLAIDKKAGATEDRGKRVQHMHGQEHLETSTIVERYEPVTEEAQQWDGWGTNLMPSIEPAVLARKPVDDGLTVAANVLKWGTGAINIDACRIAYGDDAGPGPSERPPSVTQGLTTGHSLQGPRTEPGVFTPDDLGRWPANTYQCKKPGRSEKGDACDHPTVKPVKLMRWLLQLVTPPGGVVLEPFAGSGTTLVAAKDLDLSVIGIEREPKYCDLIRARVSENSED